MFDPVQAITPSPFAQYRYHSFHIVRTWQYDGPLAIYFAVVPYWDVDYHSYIIKYFFYDAHGEITKQDYNIRLFFLL